MNNDTDKIFRASNEGILRKEALYQLIEVFPNAIADISNALSLPPQEFMQKVEAGEIEGEIDYFKRLASEARVLGAISTIQPRKARYAIQSEELMRLDEH